MKIRGTHALMAYGPVLVLSLYATWLAGRVCLGYWPRPSLDDPKYIEGFWMWTYNFTEILVFVGLPLAGILAAVSIFRPLRSGLGEWRRRLVEAIAGILLLVLASGFMRWDPHQVVEWYLD